MSNIQAKDSNLMGKIATLITVFSLITIAICAVAFTLGFKFHIPPKSPAFDREARSQTTISVSGKAEVDAKPDMAVLNVTIKDSAKEVAIAQNLINQKAKKLETALEELGIAKEDIISTSYNTYPKYESVPIKCPKEPCGSKSEIVGHNASQNIKITIRQIDLTGKVIFALGNLDINQFSGPNFSIDDPSKFKSEARKLAILDAYKNAQEIASALNVNLGKVANFEESDFPNHPIMFRSPIKFASADAEDDTKLFAGDKQIKSSVTITYFIY